MLIRLLDAHIAHSRRNSRTGGQNVNDRKIKCDFSTLHEYTSELA